MKADISGSPKHSADPKETVVHKQMCSSNLQPPALAGAMGTVSGSGRAGLREGTTARGGPTPVRSGESNGNSPDHSGKFNLREREPFMETGRKTGA